MSSEGAFARVEQELLEERAAALARIARLYRWYLVVQRDALGLRRHDGLDELYPIPEDLEG